MTHLDLHPPLNSHRRKLLLAALAAACLPAARALGEGSSVAPDVAAQLKRALEDFMDENLRAAPQMATSLGLDKGAHADARRLLNNRSLAALEAGKRKTARQLRRLEQIDASRLSGVDIVNYEAVRVALEIEHAANQRFSFGELGAGSPYVVTQMTGAYSTVPDFLDSKHEIKSAQDIDAYLARVEAFAEVLDQESDRIRHDAANGVSPPDFALDRTLQQLQALHAGAAEESLPVTSLVRRANEASLPGNYSPAAQKLWSNEVAPALARQIALLRKLRSSANDAAGVWKLPNGAEYYAACLHSATTSSMTADEMHSTGLELVTQLSADINVSLRAQGMIEGTVAQRLRALHDDPRFIYANTDAGKAQLIAFLNARLDALRPRLPKAFRTLPKASVDIRRVPAYMEPGAPPAYYQDPSLDGSRPGTFYINLRDTADAPSWIFTSTAFHETIPGHHLQQALVQERGALPLIRQVQWFQGYGEGWALYAEQLADELGVYEADPWGRIGYLMTTLFRACRLVVDTGLHARRWPRAQAIQWLIDSSGVPPGLARNEIDRYCVLPGQACSYMVGKIAWLQARDSARAQLGNEFDLREFHDAALLAGATPLTVLEKTIGRHIEARTATSNPPTSR